jgi:4-hydroxybenzoate polyprenyltransferase
MWAILMGWSAAAGHVDWLMALPMYAGGVAWGVAYDCIYAHQVRKLDLADNGIALTHRTK